MVIRARFQALLQASHMYEPMYSAQPPFEVESTLSPSLEVEIEAQRI